MNVNKEIQGSGCFSKIFSIKVQTIVLIN